MVDKTLPKILTIEQHKTH